MATRSIRVVVTLGTLSLMIPSLLFAQVQRDVVPLKPWSAPLYWQPSHDEDQASRGKSEAFANLAVGNAATDITAAGTDASQLACVCWNDALSRRGYENGFGIHRLLWAA